MVSWGRSFLVALKIVIFSIVWSIIGSVISFIVLFAMIPVSMSVNPNNPTSLIAFFLPLVLVGGIISGLGIIATLVKFTIDESLNEVKKILQSQYPISAPTTMSPPIQQSTPTPLGPTQPTQNQKICPFCGAVNPPEAKFCKVCGAKLY
ncbi:MAG: zinc-ribbon domain-containing protein [Candidatus Asgardarchaeia archaeon]